MKLSHQASILFWGRLSSQGALMARAVVLSRLMPKGEYGIYGQAMMVGALLVPFLTVGLDRAIPFFFARLSESKQKGLVLVLSAYLSLVGMLTGSILFFGAEFIAQVWHKEDMAPLLRVYAFVVAFLQLPVIVTPSLLAKGRPILSGVFGPMMEVPGAIAAALTFYFTHSVEKMFLVIAVLRVVHCGAGLAMMVRLPFRDVSASFGRGELADVVKYAMPLGLAAILGQSGRFIDHIFISVKFTNEAFAVYRNGAFEIPVFQLLTVSIFTVLLPEMSRLVHAGKSNAALRLWREGIRRSSMMVVPIIVFTFVFASDVIVILFSTSYLESVPVFRIYTASILFRVAQFGFAFTAFGHPRLILYLSILFLASGAGGCVLFIPLFGVKGPAAAALFSRYVSVLISLWLFAHTIKVSFRDVFPWAAVGRILLCSAVACGVATPLLLLGDHTGVWPAIRVFLGGIVAVPLFLWVAFRTRSILRSDLDFVLVPLLRRWQSWRGRRPHQED